MSERMKRRGSASLLGGLFLGAFLMVGGPSSAHFWPGQAEQHIKTLKTAEPKARAQAVRELAALPRSQARPGIELALADSDQLVRSFAGRVALSFAYEGLTPVVSQWLQSRDAEERKLALRIIAIRLRSDGVGLVGALLSDPDRSVRRVAAESLGRALPEAQPAAQSFLLGALDDAEPGIRQRVVASLGAVGDKSVGLFLAVHLQDPETRVREQVALALGVVGEEKVIPSLLIALSDPEPTVSATAALSLGALKAESAVAALSSVLEEAAFLERGRAAARALLEIGTDAAWRSVLSQLENEDNRRDLERMIREVPSSGGSALAECSRDSVGSALRACLRLELARGAGSDSTWEALNSRRISVEQAYQLFAQDSDDAAIVLALEELESESLGRRLEALAFLNKQHRLPKVAAAPLIQSLKAHKWVSAEVYAFLSALLVCEGADSRDVARAFLESDSTTVAEAAARLLAAQGVNGKQLRELIEHQGGRFSRDVFKQLSHGLSLEQTETVLDWLIEGRLGQRRGLLSLLVAAPANLPETTLDKAEQLLKSASSVERDEVYRIFARSGKKDRLMRLARSGNEADQQTIVQLAFYHPKGAQIAAGLIGADSPRVRQMAAQILGEKGDESAEEALVLLANSSSLHYLQAAALHALARLSQRGLLKQLPASVLSESRCQSAHLMTRLRAHELAHFLSVDCAGSTTSELLLDPDARARALGAYWLQEDEAAQLLLRRCSAYDKRAFVAEACQGEWPPTGRDHGGIEAELPFFLRQVEPVDARAFGGRPVNIWMDSQLLTFLTDRRGRILMPSGLYEAADPLYGY